MLAITMELKKVKIVASARGLYKIIIIVYRTRSPIDGKRLISNDALLLLLILFKLLLLLPDNIVDPLSSPDSHFNVFSRSIDS